jgi:hypothetical protein
VRPRRQTPPHRLGLASGHTFWLGANAAGWGRFLDPAPRDDPALTTAGNQGDQGRMCLLAVLLDETGYRFSPEQEGESWVAETLTTATRRRSVLGRPAAEFGRLPCQVAGKCLAEAPGSPDLAASSVGVRGRAGCSDSSPGLRSRKI